MAVDQTTDMPDPSDVVTIEGGGGAPVAGAGVSAGVDVPPDVPPEVPGYRVTGRLGGGGVGVVWREVHLATQREVALKLLGPAKTPRGRFEREVRLTARLDHPNVARVYDSGTYHGLYYHAMELVDGVPLDAYVKQR